MTLVERRLATAVRRPSDGVMTRVCTTVSPTLAPSAARVIPEPRRLDTEDGGWDVASLVAWSRSANAHVRNWATAVLAVRDSDSEAVRSALLDRLADSDRATRDQALLGLALRRDGRAIVPLIRALGEDGADSVLVAAAGCFACGQDAVLDRALARCRGAA